MIVRSKHGDVAIGANGHIANLVTPRLVAATLSGAQTLRERVLEAIHYGRPLTHLPRALRDFAQDAREKYEARQRQYVHPFEGVIERGIDSLEAALERRVMHCGYAGVSSVGANLHWAYQYLPHCNFLRASGRLIIHAQWRAHFRSLRELKRPGVVPQGVAWWLGKPLAVLESTDAPGEYFLLRRPARGLGAMRARLTFDDGKQKWRVTEWL